jgi:hypothetical protein
MLDASRCTCFWDRPSSRKSAENLNWCGLAAVDRRGDRPDHPVDEPEFEVEGSNPEVEATIAQNFDAAPVSRPPVHEEEVALARQKTLTRRVS